MRCLHCGSSCKDALPDELTTEEALGLIEDIARLGIEDLSLTGGEPLTRKDWRIIARKIVDCGLKLRMITNGSLIDEEAVRVLKDCRIHSIAISIDGMRETHNAIRGHNCYSSCERALRLLDEAGISCGAVTSVMKQNIGELDQIRDWLIEMGVEYWQLQISMPQGTMKEHSESVIDPKDIKYIIDWAYEQNTSGRIAVILADCFGYYTRKEMIGRQIALGLDSLPVWDGCSAGIRAFGILHNGDIVGCTSMRSFEAAGNIRERPLGDILEDENSFAWRRKLTGDMLRGYCRECVYSEKCLGGCSNTRLTVYGDIYSENRYCAYHMAMNGE